MIKPDVSHESFTLTRDYAVPVERAYAAFSDPQKKRRWFAEGDGFAVDSYRLDFRVGGSEVSVFHVDTPEFKSDEIRNDTYFLDIVPNERIIMAYSMSNAGVPFSASLQTVMFTATSAGTRLTLTEQVTFLPGSDGVDNRRRGTETLLDSLARELERAAAGRAPADA